MSSTKENFNRREINDNGIKNLSTSFEVGWIYENGGHVKYMIEKIDDNFVYLVELDPKGSVTDNHKRYPKTTLAQLICNNYFEKSRFMKRDDYNDLRKYDIGTLFRK